MKIAIVGAGVSGLVAARELKLKGHDVTVFESEDRVGGRMSSVTRDGFTMDIGANAMIGNYTAIRDYCKELGVWPWKLAEERPGGIYRHGKMTRFSLATAYHILTYKGLSLKSRLKMIKLLTTGWKNKHLDIYNLNVGDDALDREDAWSWCSREITPEFATWFLDPLLRTFHFHTPKKLSMKFFYALTAMAANRKDFTAYIFDNFMIRFPQALAKNLDVKLKTPIKEVEGTEKGVLVDGKEYDKVVVTAPAPVALKLLRNPTKEQQETLSKIEFAASMSVQYKIKKSDLGERMGVWIPSAESQLVAAMTEEGYKGSETEDMTVIQFFLHHEGAIQMMKKSDEEIFKAVADEWTRLMPRFKDTLIPLYCQRWENAIPMYDVGVVTLVKNFWQYQGQNNIYFAGDWMNHPWTEGAVRCGKEVASLLMQS